MDFSESVEKDYVVRRRSPPSSSDSATSLGSLNSSGDSSIIDKPMTDIEMNGIDPSALVASTDSNIDGSPNKSPIFQDDIDWVLNNIECDEEGNPRLMLCNETCGSLQCARRVIRQRDFNDHLQKRHGVVVPPKPENDHKELDEFMEEIAADRFAHSGYAERLRPKYVWLMGRLFLRTMVYYCENLYIALNLADGSENEAKTFEMTATVTKNESNWERRWILHMRNFKECFGSFASHPAEGPLGSFNFQVDIYERPVQTYRVKYQVRQINNLNK